MRKGQTALEYLMTYGWAILVVIIVVAALYALGLAKPCRWVGTQITGFTGGGFQIEAPKFTAGGDLGFNLKRIGATTVAGTNVTATYSTNPARKADIGGNMATGNSTTLTISGLGSPTAPTSGDCYTIDATVYYTESGRSFTAAGKISGTVEAG